MRHDITLNPVKDAKRNGLYSEAPPPCFYHKVCNNTATVEKAGKSVCSECALTLRGQGYPLRRPDWRNEGWQTVAWRMEMPVNYRQKEL